MALKIFCLMLITLVSASSLAQKPPQRSESLPAIKEYIKKLQDDRDFLGLRIFFKAYARSRGKTKAGWLAIRKAINDTPQVGNDFLFAWKHAAPFARNATEKLFQDRWVEAQKLMLQKKFVQSIPMLEQLVVHVRLRIEKEKDKNSYRHQSNLILYPYILHSLARAYYGAKDFQASLKIYQWIPSGYAPFRQVLFEKMWAAYRAGDVGGTLAAIASQKSSYFSPFLEPEAYLLQVYIYKKLCRDSELKNVLSELNIFQKQLNNGRFDLAKWSTWDAENHSLFQLINPDNLYSKNGISAAARKVEMTSVVQRLRRGFDRDVARLKREIGTIISFSGMAALSTSTSTLAPITKLPSRKKLFESGFEIWPADRGEDWVDEIGTQVYLGESRCQASQAL